MSRNPATGALTAGAGQLNPASPDTPGLTSSRGRLVKPKVWDDGTEAVPAVGKPLHNNSVIIADIIALPCGCGVGQHGLSKLARGVVSHSQLQTLKKQLHTITARHSPQSATDLSYQACRFHKQLDLTHSQAESCQTAHSTMRLLYQADTPNVCVAHMLIACFAVK